MPIGQKSTVGYNVLVSASYTQPDIYAGDLLYTRMLGKDILIINSDKVAKDLLENRSTNYSDRPYLILNEKSGPPFIYIYMALISTRCSRCGVDYSSAFLPYGDRWRLHRRFFHQTFRPEVVHRFLPYPHRRVCHLLRQLFNTPEQLEDHIFE